MNNQPPAISPKQPVRPPLQESPALEKKQKNNKLTIVASILALTLLGGLAVAYLLYLKPPTAQELYHESVRSAINVQSEENYGSFEVDSGDMKVQGEFSGGFSDNFRIRADMDVDFISEGVPMSASMELLGIEEGDVSEAYFRNKSVTSSNPEYKPYIEDYFSPTLSKWVKSDDSDDEEEEEPTSFEEDGAMAAFSALAIFAPLTSLSEADQEIFIVGIDKYNLYQASETIEDSRFRGVAARKLRISVEKDAFIEFEREMSQKLSSDAEYSKFETSFVNDLFGRSGRLAADVYIDPEEAQIIGAELKIDLRDPIEDSAYGTQLEKINSSLLVEYGRKSKIEAPKSALTETEFDALFE